MTIDTKELRRLAQAATPGPWRVDEVGVGFEIAAGDNVVAQAQSIPRDSVQHAARRANAAFIAAANPAAVSKLLDRLEAAESEAIEQARLNGMGGERELALMAKLEAAEKTNREWLRANAPGGWIDNLRIENEALRAKIKAAEKERDILSAELLKQQTLTVAAQHIAEVAQRRADALRAKVEQMEKQEPVAFALYSGWAFKAAYHKEHEACDQRDRRQLSADLGGSLEAYRVVPLYAIPGAKGE